jgi:hypothetical protein
VSLPLPDVGTLLTAALVAFVVAGLLAPFETLGWWAGWFGPHDRELAEGNPPDPGEPPPPPARGYVVFLSGVHSVSGRAFAPRERAFLARLRDELPDVRVVEVFPYSVTNRALTGQRVFARFWRFALAGKLGRRRLAGVASLLINLRNAWQVAVSADRRYGPMYDEGSAQLIERALRAQGWNGEARPPVLLVGYSGGGQIALGAAGPLSRRLGRTIDVVSLGGVMASPRSLDGLGRVVHLRGRNDRVARIGAAFFPGRWPFVPWSTWNRARAEGRIDVVDLGEMDHTGRDGYLDADGGDGDGRSYLDATVDAIARTVARSLAQPS